MGPKELFRVVALRKARPSPAEFRLREGETGLSLFAHREQPSPAQVIEAVRTAGKRGELKAAAVPAEAIRKLGLTLVQTRGGAASEEVNAIHYEARLPWWRWLAVRLRGGRPADYFNTQVSPQLCAMARLLD